MTATTWTIATDKRDDEENRTAEERSDTV